MVCADIEMVLILCQEECSNDKSSFVCGANGETFPSRCHARSMHISIDYLGKCLAVPGRGKKVERFDQRVLIYLKLIRLSTKFQMRFSLPENGSLLNL